MAKETVERILNAETAAQSAAEQAKAKAEKVLVNAQGKTELIMNDAKRSLKAYEEEKEGEARAYCENAFKKADELSDREAAALAALAAKNREAAVKAAMDILI